MGNYYEVFINYRYQDELTSKIIHRFWVPGNRDNRYIVGNINNNIPGGIIRFKIHNAEKNLKYMIAREGNKDNQEKEKEIPLIVECNEGKYVDIITGREINVIPSGSSNFRYGEYVLESTVYSIPTDMIVDMLSNLNETDVENYSKCLEYLLYSLEHMHNVYVYELDRAKKREIQHEKNNEEFITNFRKRFNKDC